jgi:hypothetical protein
MLPFALATWIVDRVDGLLGTLVLGWVVLVLGVLVATLSLGDLRVPGRRLLGPAVVVVAAWLTVAAYVIVWAGGVDQGPVGSAVCSLLASSLGALVAVALVRGGRSAPEAAVSGLVLLAVVPPLLGWAVYANADRREVDALREALEATGATPYLFEVEDYEIVEVDTTEVDGTAGIYYHLTSPDPAGIGTGFSYRSLSIVVLPADADACNDQTGCTTGDEKRVDLDDAVVLVEGHSFESDEPEIDWERVLEDVRDAEHSTYGELAQLHE